MAVILPDGEDLNEWLAVHSNIYYLSEEYWGDQRHSR
jgi:hypothetical protein